MVVLFFLVVEVSGCLAQLLLAGLLGVWFLWFAPVWGCRLIVQPAAPAGYVTLLTVRKVHLKR
jgi:hypothetical protein